MNGNDISQGKYNVSVRFTACLAAPGWPKKAINAALNSLNTRPVTSKEIWETSKESSQINHLSILKKCNHAFSDTVVKNCRPPKWWAGGSAIVCHSEAY